LHRSTASGLTKDVVAEDHVVLQEFGSDPAAPRNKVTAVTVTALFSAVTNQIERVVAVRDVVFDQVKTNQTVHATGQEAVYTAANNETRLTGDPVGRTDRYLITGASCLIWQSKSNRFSAFGPFSMSNPNPARPAPKP
jgi:lipopolysaccharide export system protein LptA